MEPTVSQLFDLSGKVALITGAGGHLGSAMARALAEAGARVVAASRDLARADAIAASLVDSNGAGHFGAEIDQLDGDSIDHAVERIVEKAGRIDILVNNGHDPLAADWSTISAEQFNRQLSNATGYFLLARHVRNLAVERSAPASVVMIGSMYGQVASYPDAYDGIGPASPAAYHALKGGVIHLTRHLAVYWGADRVRVNCLSPGPFPGPKAPAELVERLKKKSPLGRMGMPSELKGALLLLASDAGSYITGQNLTVDGGWTAW
jgi:gluconate 5-dehydrogenase